MPRKRLVFAAWLTVLALPILVLDNIPRTVAGASGGHVATAAAPSPTSSTASTVPLTWPSTVPPTWPPTTAAPPTTARKTTPTTSAVRAAAATAPAVASPPPTTAAPAPVATNSQEGAASWYDYRPGECAHPSLPFGTVVSITNLSNGLTASCTVTDRGPYGAGRIIDLDRGTFAQLANPGAGVITVRITW